MEKAPRPAIFKGRQTEPGFILCAVRWYLRYSLSLRDVEELLVERGLEADHTTIWRWVQRYGPELDQRLRRHLKSTNKSWRVDETYVQVKGRWCYLYRAIDSRGATIDFLLSALRDAAAAKRLFRKALSDPSHPQPRVINTDEAAIYRSAIPAMKKEGTLRRRCKHQDLYSLADWLKACEIKTVAMESTGVYWIPLFQILEQRGFEVCLVNARHVKNVPGRRTDVCECQWLQFLHSVGLLKASYRPAQEVCAIRSLLRHRETLVQMAATHVNHMQKAIDQMNVQLHHVISDIVGQTGLAIVDAILAGQRDPLELAKVARGAHQSE